MKTRICANPSCDRPPFELKNPKKKFHDTRCKNQSTYLYKKNVYDYEFKMQKARLKNIQVLEYLINNGHSKIEINQLTLLGFDLNAAYLASIGSDNSRSFFYGNIEMRLVSETSCKISYIKTTKNDEL